MSAEDARIARDLWAEVGRQEMAYPTPTQLVRFIRLAPDHIAEGVAGRILDDQQTAARCVQFHREERP